MLRKFLDRWKKADVNFSKPGKNLTFAASYRLISLLPVLNKVAERVILKRLQECMDELLIDMYSEIICLMSLFLLICPKPNMKIFFRKNKKGQFIKLFRLKLKLKIDLHSLKKKNQLNKFLLLHGNPQLLKLFHPKLNFHIIMKYFRVFFAVVNFYFS